MNKAKTYFVYSLLLVLNLTANCLATNQRLITITNEATENHDNFDDLFNIEQDAFDDASTQQLVAQHTSQATRDGDSCSPYITIIGLLEEFPNLKEILQEDLYCHTNPIITRSLLDNPLFLTRLSSHPYPWYTSIDLFWNETNRANFTSESNHISSYLALTNEKIFQIVPKSCKDKALIIFPALAQGRLEERRAGGMLQMGYAWDSFTLRSMVPLYYLERNYQLSQANKNALMVQLGETTEDEQKRFQKDHLISDKCGFGDLRLYGDFSLVNKEHIRINTGPLVTVPTAFALVKGIEGSHYKPCCPRPTIDLQEVCACLINADFDIISNLALQALDTLSAIILEQPLGNRGHFGIGCFFDFEYKLSALINRPWTDKFMVQNYLSFEYFTPRNETRYFISIADPAAYDRRDFHSEADAAENLQFIEHELIDTVFPYNFNTKIKPGPSFWWNAQAIYQGNRMGCSCGLDFWAQGKEKLSHIQATLPCNELAICTAPAPLAYQLKVLGSLSYTLNRPTCQWQLGLGADKTFMRSGIGKDYTVSAFLRASF